MLAFIKYLQELAVLPALPSKEQGWGEKMVPRKLPSALSVLETKLFDEMVFC